VRLRAVPDEATQLEAALSLAVGRQAQRREHAARLARCVADNDLIIDNLRARLAQLKNEV
jgi:hypothetical protein